MIFEKRRHLIPWQAFPSLDREHAAVTKGHQSFSPSYPHNAILRGENRIHLRRGQSLTGRKGSDSNVTEAINAPGRRNPQVAFTILVETVHVVAGKTICTVKVVHLAP